MTTEREQLVRLQDELDRKAIIVENLAKLVGEKEKLENERKKAEADHKATIEEEKDHERKIKAKELEVGSLKDKIINGNVKLNSVKTNKEYQALVGEIKTLEEEVRHKEDAILDLMEETETIKKKIATAVSEFKRTESDFSARVSVLSKEIEGRQKELSQSEEKVEGLILALPAKLQHEARKQMKSRSGKVIVQVVDVICQGCFQSIPPQEFIVLKVSDDLMTCRNCQRYLYYKKPD